MRSNYFVITTDDKDVVDVFLFSSADAVEATKFYCAILALIERGVYKSCKLVENLTDRVLLDSRND